MTQSPFTRFEPFVGGVERSASYGRRRFPTRADYARAFSASNPHSDPWADPAFSAAVMRHWHTRGQTGCLFARRLATVAMDAQWQSVVFTSKEEDGLAGEVGENLEPALRLAIGSPDCEIVSLLFPQIDTIAGLKRVCNLLTQTSPITMSEMPAPPSTVITALRMDISGDGKLAWIMAFGPFDSWPPTRRGPLLEFAIRVKPKPAELFHKLNQDADAAHLADSNPQLTEAQMEKVFDRTEKATRDVLGGDPDRRSAAKATFSFPTVEWTGTE